MFLIASPLWLVKHVPLNESLGADPEHNRGFVFLPGPKTTWDPQEKAGKTLHG